MAEGKKIKITQTGSPIGRTDDQRATLVGLGLNKRHRSLSRATRKSAFGIGTRHANGDTIAP